MNNSERDEQLELLTENPCSQPDISAESDLNLSISSEESFCNNEDYINLQYAQSDDDAVSSYSVFHLDVDEAANLMLKKDVQNWSIKHGCTRHCINDILNIFNKNGHNLPKDSRTLLHTRKNVVTQPMGDGEYIYYGVKSTIEKTFIRK